MLHLRHKALEELRSKKPHVAKKSSNGNVVEEFGSMVFGERELREKLAPKTYQQFKKAVEEGTAIDANVADQVAAAMKDWAMLHGATHFTHWFQPLTGLTAEKHDSFLNFSHTLQDRSLSLNFSGKQLIKGEPDASSFPSGGSRSTFEARGYTAWDMESPSFLLDGANGAFLCVPSAFASWNGESLDMKTPLLRSNEALSKASTRVLKLIGDKKTTSCYSNLGCEQEFFVIDRGFYLARPDLVACGRSLLGAQPAKGQQMEDHYFGSLDRRILAFMQDVEWRLWRLGVPSTTRHNEVAPSQYELAPIFEKVSLACDHNMLMMEVLRETAREHDLACLLHEKPFAGVNGSGKHNNWSISTNHGENMMDPGDNPRQNIKFIVFLAAVVRAICLHGDVLRNAVAVPGNEHRLGANEAPPAIISIFMGSQLTEVIESICQENKSSSDSNNVNNQPTKIERQQSKLILGVNAIPALPRDASDRNRTSPFAFTGNKFEFRAVGSSQSCARPVTLLNAIVTESLEYVADVLEKEAKKAGLSEPNNDIIQSVVAKILSQHKQVIFNGNGYSDEWREEATKVRKLWHLNTLPEAVREFSSEKNVKLFESLGILTKKEVLIQQSTLYENYSKTIAIEADCIYQMTQAHVLPAVLEYKKTLIGTLDEKEAIQKQYLEKYNSLISKLLVNLENLKNNKTKAKKFHEEELFEQATFYRNDVYDSMVTLRAVVDEFETLVDDKLWPFPKYSEILFLK